MLNFINALQDQGFRIFDPREGLSNHSLVVACVNLFGHTVTSDLARQKQENWGDEPPFTSLPHGASQIHFLTQLCETKSMSS